MTKQKLYSHIEYTWYLLVLRVILIGPFVLIKGISDIISTVSEKVYWKLHEMLPVCYTETKVEFDQLSKREQKKIQELAKIRGAILSQVQS